MLYEPLCHLGSLYAGAFDAMQGEAKYPVISILSDSVLQSLGQACAWTEQHQQIKMSPKAVRLIKHFLDRIRKTNRLLNIWVDDHQFIRILCRFECRWQQIVAATFTEKEDLGELLLRDSQQRLEQLQSLGFMLKKESQLMLERFGVPATF